MGSNTNLGIWFKLSLGSRVSFGLKVESKSRNWDSHSSPINGMWLSKIGYSISRFVSTKIDVVSGMWSNLGKDTEDNIYSNFGIESRNENSNSYFFQVQFHWNKNLPICQWFDKCQVQDNVMKLNLSWSLHDARILDSCQYG